MPRVVLHAVSTETPVDDWSGDLVIADFPYVLGRHPECSAQLHDPQVSRYHCSLFLQGEQVWVQDMNSCNGTYVNGQLALLPRLLSDGDQLRLATLVFHVAVQPGDADSSGRLLRSGQGAAAGAC